MLWVGRRSARHRLTTPHFVMLPHWSVERLKRAVKRFVAEGLAEPNLLRPATRRASSERLLTLVAGVARANPDLTLAPIGAQLEAMYERTLRGGTRWSPSSIKSLLDRARKLGMLGAEQD